MRSGVQMNTRKDRYAVRISESSYIEMQEQELRDGAKQGIAVALWRWKRRSAGARYAWNVCTALWTICCICRRYSGMT